MRKKIARYIWRLLVEESIGLTILKNKVIYLEKSQENQQAVLDILTRSRGT